MLQPRKLKAPPLAFGCLCAAGASEAAAAHSGPGPHRRVSTSITAPFLNACSLRSCSAAGASWAAAAGRLGLALSFFLFAFLVCWPQRAPPCSDHACGVCAPCKPACPGCRAALAAACPLTRLGRGKNHQLKLLQSHVCTHTLTPQAWATPRPPRPPTLTASAACASTTSSRWEFASAHVCPFRPALPTPCTLAALPSSASRLPGRGTCCAPYVGMAAALRAAPRRGPTSTTPCCARFARDILCPSRPAFPANPRCALLSRITRYAPSPLRTPLSPALRRAPGWRHRLPATARPRHGLGPGRGPPWPRHCLLAPGVALPGMWRIRKLLRPPCARPRRGGLRPLWRVHSMGPGSVQPRVLARVSRRLRTSLAAPRTGWGTEPT